MLLHHDGTTLNFFEEFPKDWTRVGLLLSGGADSALMLYLLVKMAQERNQHMLIFPATAYDVSTPFIVTYQSAENIIKWIVDNTGYNYIQPMIVAPYMNVDDTKDNITTSTTRYLFQRYLCDGVLDGTSLGMPNSARPGPAGYKWIENDQIRSLSVQYPHEFPWATVNKQFIAAQYKKFGIEELSTLTNSCVNSSITPCKECWWCQERYWAFGSYDGGIQ